MTHFEIEESLSTMSILVDTREQDTPQYRKRIHSMGCPAQRVKLEFGDYSAQCMLPDGGIFDLSNSVAVERKMHLDELCQCYTRWRERFVREFERAKATGAKLYLMIENGSWEKAYGEEYRTKMNAKALIASMTAWMARYDCQLIFCGPDTSGVLIKEILYRELKERLERLREGAA